MALQILKSLKSAYSNLNPEHVRRMADQPLNIQLVADSEEAFAGMERYLVPGVSSSADRAGGLLSLHRVSSTTQPLEGDIVIVEQGLPCPRGAFTFYTQHPEETIESILDARSDLEVPLARHFLSFRKCAIRRIIGRIARENAMFTLMTAVPNIVPSFFELPWAVGEYATDSAFLTVNQIRMAFLIAAASGKDVGLSQQKAEIMGIVASAFGWRAVARELIGKIPLGGGLIPKAAISWAGTFVVGRAVEQVYLTGERLRRHEHREMYAKALETGRQVANSLLRTFRKPTAA